MSGAAKKAVQQYRRRARQKGLVRLEVQIPRQDVEPVRAIAALLRDADQALVEHARRDLLELTQGRARVTSLKDLLAAAPFDGVEFERPRDLGRKIDLP